MAIARQSLQHSHSSGDDKRLEEQCFVHVPIDARVTIWVSMQSVPRSYEGKDLLD
jgi:hypothetical protein